LATYTYNGKKSFAGEFFDSLATFYRKRWLLRYFVRRQVTRSYKRSYLGLAWAILGPLIWVFFLTLIFSEVVGLRFREVEDELIFRVRGRIAGRRVRARVPVHSYFIDAINQSDSGGEAARLASRGPRAPNVPGDAPGNCPLPLLRNLPGACAVR